MNESQVITLTSCWPLVSGCLRVLRLRQALKLVAEIMLKVSLNTINYQVNQFSFPTKIMTKDEIFAHTHIYIYGYTGGCLIELRRIVNTGSATSGTGIDHTSAASQFITVHFVQSLVFSWVMFCQSMFVFLSFFL